MTKISYKLNHVPLKDNLDVTLVKGQIAITVSVSFLLLCYNTIIKITCKRKRLIWGLHFKRVKVHDYHGRERGSRQA